MNLTPTRAPETLAGRALHSVTANQKHVRKHKICKVLFSNISACLLFLWKQLVHKKEYCYALYR